MAKIFEGFYLTRARKAMMKDFLRWRFIPAVHFRAPRLLFGSSDNAAGASASAHRPLPEIAGEPAGVLKEYACAERHSPGGSRQCFIERTSLCAAMSALGGKVDRFADTVPDILPLTTGWRCGVTRSDQTPRRGRLAAGTSRDFAIRNFDPAPTCGAGSAVPAYQSPVFTVFVLLVCDCALGIGR